MMDQKEIIYLDNNSSTQIDKRVLAAMMPYLTDQYANANSTHFFGLSVNDAVKKARHQISELIGASDNEVVFTSGSTEAINLALKGIAENYSLKGNHIITVSTEHKAVLDTSKYLEKHGYKFTFLPVKKDGLIDLSNLKNAIIDDTILVAVMLANNETGVIQPLNEISRIVHEKEALLFCDATQAIGKINVNVDELGVDLLCLSGHKFYAPKGVGALFIRQRINRVKLSAQIHGGGHERNLRSGTLNVPSIVGLGTACEIAKKEMSFYSKEITYLRNLLESELLKIGDTFINGNINQRLFNTSNILFQGIDSDALILGLNNNENEFPMIAVSSGSACTAASIEPSHVLIAMGLDEKSAFSSIRFSLGKFNTQEEIEITVRAINKVINDLRAFS